MERLQILAAPTFGNKHSVQFSQFIHSISNALFAAVNSTQ